MKMTVRELILALLDADTTHGTVVVSVPTGKWTQITEIENVRIRPWGVELEAGMVDTDD